MNHTKNRNFMTYYVYIITNKKNGVLYVGVTNNLVHRMHQHKNKLIDGFSARYNLTKLVYAEECQSIIDAIAREKKLKKWHRKWKIELIESINADWNDLYESLF